MINKETESDLSEDNSDKESVAETGLHGRGVSITIDVAEADVDQRQHTDLVTIGHQGATFVTLDKRANKCTVRTWMVIPV